MNAPVLTLTTDFGQRDAYVAVMKGVILGIAPDVRLIDVTHDVAPQDVMEAAFVLRGAAPFFPEGTVHLAVIDPGVGTERLPVALRHDGHVFVGPDNGLFSLLIGPDGAPEEAVVLDRPEYWRGGEVSATFHGRDVFAPVAAHLAAGRPLAEVGRPLDALTPLRWALPIEDDQGMQGWVVHVDRFGNCITNLDRDAVEARRAGRAVKCYVGSGILHGLERTYGAVAAGEPLLLYGSAALLEIAVNSGNAAELLGIQKGTPVNVVFQ